MFDEWFPPRYPEKRKVAVNTKDGQTLRGVLWERRRDYLLLKSAEIVQGRETVPMDGDCVIPSENVAFYQVLYGVG